MTGPLRVIVAAAMSSAALAVATGFAAGPVLAQNQLPSFVDERRLPLDAPGDQQPAEAEAEAQRKAEEEAARKRAEEAERARQAAEAEAQRKAEQEAARKRAEETERARQAAEAEAQRKAEQEAARKRAEEAERARQAAEAEAQRKAEQEAARKRAEEAERARQAAEAEAQRKAEQEAARKRAEEAERARQAAEAEAQRKAEQEAARKRAEAADRSRRAAAPERNTAADDLARRMSSGGSCGNVQLATKAQPAGRLEINAQAPCLAGRDVTFSYAGHDFVRTAGGDGVLAFTLDLFEGAAPLVMRLDDGTTKDIDLSGVDLTGISKVAVLWSAPVNLDLHALEYLAPRGGPGHVWAKAPSSLQAALKAAKEGSRGRGFISMDDDGAGPGIHAEVYTFLHNKSQRHGAITLLIDYETRGDVPSGEHCGNGRLAEIEAQVVRLRPGGRVEKETVRLGPAPCGQQLPEAKRFNSDTLSDLVAKG